MITRTTIATGLLFACLGGGFAPCLSAGEPSLISTPEAAPAAAPRNRALESAELVTLLTGALQDEYVRQKGELELTLTRAWDTRQVPDEPLTVKILELPNAGVTSSFIVRFELRTADRSLGNWQVPVRARVWRDIWVAHSPIKEGTLVAESDIVRERRDVLTQRSQLADFAEGDTTLELAEALQPGYPVLARSVKLRPVVRRGQLADALVQEGTLTVSMKVELLEDGVPGQIVRARNPQSRRDVTGRVINNKTIQITL